MTITSDTPVSFRYRGNDPLPGTVTHGQFVVSKSGELHLGLDDTYVKIAGLEDTSQVEETVEKLELLVGE